MPDNPIEEYFDKEGGGKGFATELFKAGDDVIDQKTELTSDEVRHINTLAFTDQYLKSRGIRRPIYEKYYLKFMRLMVSHERKSRKEYVDVNKSDRETQQVFNMGSPGMTPK